MSQRTAQSLTAISTELFDLARESIGTTVDLARLSVEDLLYQADSPEAFLTDPDLERYECRRGIHTGVTLVGGTEITGPYNGYSKEHGHLFLVVGEVKVHAALIEYVEEGGAFGDAVEIQSLLDRRSIWPY